MKIVKFFVGVFKSYGFVEVMISVGAFVVILAMFVKMLIFPYGMLNFGVSNIYTEGIVARNGIQNINPLFVDYNEADREISRLVFSGLMKYDPVNNAVVDDMATLTINEDKTEYTFALRDGLQWHDGDALTTEDVYFTFHDIVMDESFQNEILKTNFAGVEIEMIDEVTIKFILEKPNIFFVTNLTTGIVPKHILEEADPYDLLQHEFNKMPIGSGPYMVEDPVEAFSDSRTQMTLVRNPYYYDEPSDIERMRFIVYPTMDQLLKHINSVNGVVKIGGKHILEFINNDRFDLMQYELPQYMAVFMNLDSKILGDSKLVRLALQKAIDKEELTGLFGEEDIGYVDKVRVDTPLLELNQEDWEYQPSIEQAQGALKDAGYSYGPDDVDKLGIRYGEDEGALELNLITWAYEEGSDQYEETAAVVGYLQQQWESIGFDINVEFLAGDQFKERVMTRQYDLLFVGQNLGYNLDTYSYWHSAQASPWGQNFSNYKSFKVDSLIEDVRAVFNVEKRGRELSDMAEQIKDDVPAVFLYRPVYYYASDGKVSGVSMEGVTFPSDRFAGISGWKFER